MPDEIRGIAMAPELDEQAGAVRLPLDRFVETPEELDVLTVAGSVLTFRCARDQGVPAQASGQLPESSHAIYESESYFGPWTTDQAQRFGFVSPSSDNDLVANGITERAEGTAEPTVPPNARLTEADWAVVDECVDGPEQKMFAAALTHDGPWEESMQALPEALLRDDRTEELVSELTECYEDHGLEPGDELAWYPRGARADEISEEQIVLAMQVVTCKEEIDFTMRLAKVEAELQAPLVEKYADELIAKRAQIDEAVVKARAVIAANGDMFEPVA
ncbi:hypothetical protein [Sanguibacter suaedae]|uniref:Uncharacterized protein n=1 Tax=Sanguibacter suaedae TaxID=2795737 RepID=A0A934M7S0_9MICO|nr:hypothetical protein [Sanguibacter suaedae]MBI9115722.1 hypothetical protein [Sanguibacter suaedae]